MRRRRRQRLGAVGVGADEFGLAVPQPGEVERDVGRHADEHDPAAGREIRRPGRSTLRCRRSRDDVGAAGEVVADHGHRRRSTAHERGQLVGRDDDGRRRARWPARCWAGTWRRRRSAGRGQLAQAGDRASPIVPAPSTATIGCTDVAAGGDRGARAARRGCRRRSARRSPPARRACRRGPRGAGRCGRRTPAPSRRRFAAEPGLEAGFEMAGGEVGAVVAVAAAPRR